MEREIEAVRDDVSSAGSIQTQEVQIEVVNGQSGSSPTTLIEPRKKSVCKKLTEDITTFSFPFWLLTFAIILHYSGTYPLFFFVTRML